MEHEAVVSAPPQPFFDLDDCIEAAEKAAISARKLALDNPEQAERHEARAVWYDERVRQWTEELERDDVQTYSIPA